MNTLKKYTPSSAPLLAGLAVLLAVSGCAPRYDDYSAFLSEPRPLVTTQAYLLAPPDTVLIHSAIVSEINGHRETIRPDGYITVPLLGSVFVAGRTPEDVSDELETRAREFYQDAEVSLRVASYASQKIFVFGEVGLPGAYAYNGANTVLETLAVAQPTRLADPGRIQVLRPDADGELRKRMTIDLNRMVREGDTALNAVLQDGDILYIPPNALASVGLAIQQLLLPIQPAANTVRGTNVITDDNRGRYGD